MTRPVWVVASGRTAKRWAGSFRDEGIDAVALAWGDVEGIGAERFVAPVLEAGRPDVLFLTSANAVRYLPTNTPLDVPAACVGRATAQAAAAAGLEVRWTGSGTGLELAQRLAEEQGFERILFLRAAEVAPEAVLWLRARGRVVDEVVVYEARAREAFGADVRAAADPAAFALGSPRAVGALARALDLAGRGELRERPAAAIGSPTAAALEAHGFTCRGQANPPGVDGLLETVRDLLRMHPSR